MSVYNITSITLINLLRDNDLDEFSVLTGILYSDYDLIVANSLVDEMIYYIVYQNKLYRSHGEKIDIVVPRAYYMQWLKNEYPLVHVRLSSDIETKIHRLIQEVLGSPLKKYKSENWKFRKTSNKLILKYLGFRCKIKAYSPQHHLYTDFKTVTN